MQAQITLVTKELSVLGSRKEKKLIEELQSTLKKFDSMNYWKVNGAMVVRDFDEKTEYKMI